MSASVLGILAGCATLGEQRMQKQATLGVGQDLRSSVASAIVPVQAPSGVTTALMQAPLLKAQNVLVKGDFAQALARFEEIAQTGALTDLAQIGQSVALFGLGEEARAQQLLANLEARKDSLTTNAKINLGFALAISGAPTKAIMLLLPIAESLEANASARQNLALAYALAGARTAALNWARVDLDGTSAVRRVAAWDGWQGLSSMQRVSAVFDLSVPIESTISAPTGSNTVQIAQATAIVATPQEVTQEPSAPMPLPQAGSVVDASAEKSVQNTPVAPTPAVAATSARQNWVVQLAALPTQAHIETRQAELERRHLAMLRKIGAFTTAPGPRGLTRLIIGQFERYQDAAQACRLLQGQNIPCFARVMPTVIPTPSDRQTAVLMAR